MANHLEENPKHAIVVAMGDIGRSPRMCYHALSLASHGITVDLVGYVASTAHEKIASNNRIRLVPVKPVPNFVSQLFRPIALVLKFIWLFFTMLYSMMFSTKANASIILMQNPPGIPTMLICYWASKLKGAHFIIDWHNYTFSILDSCNELQRIYRNRSRHYEVFTFRGRLLMRYVQLAAWWEGFWGRKASWNLCVSRAMQRDLQLRWNITALTLYDKPPSWIFRPMNSEERHEFLTNFLKLPEFQPALKRFSANPKFSADDNSVLVDEGSIFSRRNPQTGHIEFLPTRPLLVISSTSWTPDEDFGILLDALREYERHALSVVSTIANEELPRLLVVITGKGQLRDEYMAKFSKFHSAYVQVVSIWLTAEEYPKILASADIGVSLHTSTSGLDLPMKVVDMFGCHLPVIAKRFEAIGELVVEGSGLLFDNALDLKRGIIELASGFPLYNESLKKLKRLISSQLQASWEQQWDAVFWPVINAGCYGAYSIQF